jgi:high-affinity K+ transport system ATPase subunit B
MAFAFGQGGREFQGGDPKSRHGFVEVLGKDAVAIVRQVRISLLEADTLRRGDVVLVEANETIPADGTVVEGATSV